MIKQYEDSESEITYTRKPISFILPALENSQATKNPFHSRLQGKTMPASFQNLHVNTSRDVTESVKVRWLSLTPTSLKRAKLDMKKVQKPSTFANEPPSPTSEDEKKIETSKEERKIVNFDIPSFPEDEEEKYKAKLTKEIEHYFRELPNIGFIAMEEVIKKYTILPDHKGKQKNTLLLDLDDTLVHTIDPKLNYKTIQINSQDVKNSMYHDPYLNSIISIKVIIRPFAIKFLQELKSFYEIVVCYFPSILRFLQQDIKVTRKW